MPDNTKWSGNGDPKLKLQQWNQYLIEGYRYQAKIEGLTCHTLRHAFCHNLVVEGERLDIIAELAGHKSLDTTRIYTMPSRKEKQAAVEKTAEGE